jgi:hypothetical protein
LRWNRREANKKHELFLNFNCELLGLFLPFNANGTLQSYISTNSLWYPCTPSKNRVIPSLLCPNKIKVKGVYGGCVVGEWVGSGCG